MPSLPAYEAYLRYRSYQWQFTPEASQRSRECLEQALALDPEFALPYVGLADYHLALAAVGGIPVGRGDAAGARAGDAGARHRSGAARSARHARHRRGSLRLRLGRSRAPVPPRRETRAAVASPASVVRHLLALRHRPRQ